MTDLPLLKCCSLVLLLAYLTASQSQTSIKQTSTGPIQGTLVNIEGRTVSQYLGIPYAQPPLRDLRFRKPQPIHPWSETLNATEMPKGCIQYLEYKFPWYVDPDDQSEDCLYLNIWVPEAEDRNDNQIKKSVMFWIHGGAFAYSSIRKPLYDGRALAAVGDVIVVTTNYRLNGFGFFTTNTDDAPVNVALYDMLEALKWVNKNIDAFGGDPNEVTVFGESGGSVATGMFCVSPLTKGLFKRAIMESGSPASIIWDVNATSLVISQTLAEALGCADALKNIVTSPKKVADCMRKKNETEIAKTLYSFNPNFGAVYNPVFGNEFLPDNNVQESLKTGNFHNVSVLIGNNRDEGSFLLTFLFPEIFGFFGEKLPKLNASITQNLLKHILKVTLKDMPGTDLITQTILGKLSTSDYRKNLKLIYDFLGDFSLVCPDVYFAESVRLRGMDAYFYFFKHKPSTTPYAKWMGVAHYEEVQFVFGSPLKESNKYDCEEFELSKHMMELWSNFAKYGDPCYEKSKESNPDPSGLLQGVPKLDKWPIYSRETPLYLILDKNTTKVKRYGLGPHKVNCDLFRAINGFI